MRINIKTLTLLFLMTFIVSSSYAQEETSDMVLNKPDKFYWYFITISMEKNKETKLNEYKVRPAGGLYYGNMEKFKKALWGNRSSLRLAVGPYWNKSTAKNAQKIYSQLNKKKADMRVLDYIKDDQVHWYYLKVKKKRAGYKLEPTLARVASGTVQGFYDALNEGLVQEMLAVGPFNDYNESEDSKALYRAQEDLRSRR